MPMMCSLKNCAICFSDVAILAPLSTVRRMSGRMAPSSTPAPKSASTVIIGEMTNATVKYMRNPVADCIICVAISKSEEVRWMSRTSVLCRCPIFCLSRYRHEPSADKGKERHRNRPQEEESDDKTEQKAEGKRDMQKAEHRRDSAGYRVRGDAVPAGQKRQQRYRRVDADTLQQCAGKPERDEPKEVPAIRAEDSPHCF